MLRLVWKDVVAARWLLLAGLPIYVLNIATMVGVRPVFVLMGLVFSGALAFGSLAMEEIQGTELLWASLPVRRRDIVVARYLTTFLGAAAGLGISLGVDRALAGAGLGRSVRAPLPLTASLISHLILLLLLLWIASVLLPLCFRLGAASGAMAFGAVGVGTLLLLTLGGQALLWLAGLSNPLLDAGLYRGQPDSAQVQAAVEWLRRWGWLLLALASLLTGLALVISAGVSRWIFENRDISD